MKTFGIILLVATTFISGEKPDPVQWKTWNEAIEIANEKELPIFVFVHAEWCHLCKRMDTQVFTDSKVAERINTSYVPVKLDAEYKGALKFGDEEYTAGQLLSELTDDAFRGIPSYLFLPANNKKKHVLLGGLKDPEEMMKILKKNQ